MGSKSKPKDEGVLMRRIAVYLAGLLGGLLVYTVLKPDDMSMYQDNDKLGAGMLFLSGDTGLFIQRRTDKLWLIPGGRFNASVDMDFFAAAMRLSSEVLGYLPQHELREEITVKYDKARDLDFTLFLATVPAPAKESFLPRIDEEVYTKAEWLPVKGIEDQLTYMHRAVQQAWKGDVKAKVMMLTS